MSNIRVQYRPQTFREFLGNESVVKSILHSIDREQAYFLYGQSGCGKTTLARLIANYHKIDATFDTYEINAAQNNSIKDIRHFLSGINLRPVKSRKKVFILDEIHCFAKPAQSALLPTVEEPPPWVIFIMCSSEHQDVLHTLRNRCAQYEVRALDKDLTCQLVATVAEKENIAIDTDSIDKIFRKAMGVPRQALALLDKYPHMQPVQEKASRPLVRRKLRLDPCSTFHLDGFFT
jgi:DNA polymerase III subunit gamma/tau